MVVNIFLCLKNTVGEYNSKIKIAKIFWSFKIGGKKFDIVNWKGMKYSEIQIQIQVDRQREKRRPFFLKNWIEFNLSAFVLHMRTFHAETCFLFPIQNLLNKINFLSDIFLGHIYKVNKNISFSFHRVPCC